MFEGINVLRLLIVRIGLYVKRFYGSRIVFNLFLYIDI